MIKNLANGTLIYWILGALMSTLLLAASLQGAWVNTHLTSIDAEMNDRQARLSTVEAKVELLESQLNRIEAKLDRALQGRN